MNKFGMEVCAALGLPANSVAAIRIDILPDETLIEVKLVARDHSLADIIERYRLVSAADNLNEQPWTKT